MVDQHVIASRLSVLEGYLARLEAFRKMSREDFIGDEDSHLLAERLLHLSCESMLDIAQHVISDLGLRQPEGWMGFRNVLVHLYLTIDHGRCWETIRNDLGDLDAFAARMERFLQE